MDGRALFGTLANVNLAFRRLSMSPMGFGTLIASKTCAIVDGLLTGARARGGAAGKFGV